MKTNELALVSVIFLLLLFTITPNTLASGSAPGSNPFKLEVWFGFLELPFLIVCLVYSFKTAMVLKGGVFGTGLMYLAWGFLVMAIGHLAMQLHHVLHFDIFRDTLGYRIGSMLWFTALIITWGLSAYGFYHIYRVSRKV